MRNGIHKDLTLIDSSELVPGDVVEVPNNMLLPCDLILLSGTCIVNESSLTGESIPVIKASIPSSADIFNRNSDTKYSLFSGTKVI